MSLIFSDTYEFPAVTICNLNRMKKSLLNNTKYEEILEVDTYYQGQMDLVYQPDGKYVEYQVANYTKYG